MESSASSRGTAQAAASSNEYRTVLPRLPTGKLVTDSVFLHADLAGRPYRVQDFRDALRNAIDLKEISSIGQFQMSHVWMVTCKSALAKAKLVALSEVMVKNRRCIVIDPEPAEVKMKLLWLPERLEDIYIREALQPFGKVTSVSRESWRVADMEDMKTLNRDVVLSLADGVTVAEIPHVLTVCGVQSLLLIPGRPPLCLRCNRVGHIRRHCRTPRCENCRRFGHSADECVVSYADKLRHRTRPQEDAVKEHIMDATEVIDAKGDLPTVNAMDISTMNTSVPADASTTSVTLSESTSVSERCEATACRSEKQPLCADEASLNVKSANNKDITADAVVATSSAPDQRHSQGNAPVPALEVSTKMDTAVPKRRASYASVSSEENDISVPKQSRGRRPSQHKEKHRRSRSRRPGGSAREGSPSPSTPDSLE